MRQATISLWLSAMGVLVVAACSTHSVGHAPIETRSAAQPQWRALAALEGSGEATGTVARSSEDDVFIELLAPGGRERFRFREADASPALRRFLDRALSETTNADRLWRIRWDEHGRLREIVRA